MTTQASSKKSMAYKKIITYSPHGSSQRTSGPKAAQTLEKEKIGAAAAAKAKAIKQLQANNAPTSPWTSDNKAMEKVRERPPGAIVYPPRGGSTTSACSSVASASSIIRASKQQPIVHIASSHTGRYESSSIGARNMPTDRFYNPSAFEKGVVLCVPTHSHQYDQRAHDSGDPNQSMSSLGIVNSKYRKYIVVARFAKHAIGLPIYTYHGNGLEYKDDANKDEHVSIRGSECKNAGAKADTSHGILYSALDYSLCSKTIPFHRMTAATVCKYTEPYCITFNTKCTIFGRLEFQSSERLQSLYQRAVNNSIDPNRTPTRGNFAQGSCASGASQMFSQNFHTGGLSVAGGRSMR